MFYGAAQPLQELRLPDAVRAVASGACAGQLQCLRIDLGRGVQRVGRGAFSGCIALRELVLPAAVTRLEADALEGCEALRSIIAPGLTPENFDARQLLRAALGFCRGSARYAPDMTYRWRETALAHRQELLRLAVDWGMLDAVSWYTDGEQIPAAEFPALLEYAQQAKAMEIVALLLDYRQRVLAGADPFAQFEL